MASPIGVKPFFSKCGLAAIKSELLWIWLPFSLLVVLSALIQRHKPQYIYACDLSEAMLEQLRKNYTHVETILADVRDLSLPAGSIDVVFINACYPNIVDKIGAFANISRMMKPEGRIVISHPLGKGFIHSLKESIPFPLDDFPDEQEADTLLKPFGFNIENFIDEPQLYILVATKMIK